MQLVRDANDRIGARKCKKFYFVQNAIFQDKMTKKTANFVSPLGSNHSHW